MSENKNFTESAWVDPDDAPELTKEWFDRGDVYHGRKLISRGRPVGSGSKKAITIRFDEDIITAFRAKGKGWQTAMNDALREWLKTHV
jgi:uncharacterized protein (DUF4415 family)